MFFFYIFIYIFLSSNILRTHITWISLSTVFACALWSSGLISLLLWNFTALIKMFQQILILFSFLFVKSSEFNLLSICLLGNTQKLFILMFKLVNLSFKLVYFRVAWLRFLWSSRSLLRIRWAWPVLLSLLLVGI